MSKRTRLPILRGRAKQLPCLSCGLCCSYVAVDIDDPSTLKGATNILWYLYHEGVCIYADEGDWMVQFDTQCRHLQPDNRCGIYEHRPPICREYDERTCEVNADEVGMTFYTPREFLAYLEQHHKRIHSLVRKRFMPPEDTLDDRSMSRKRLGPFGPRFDARRALRGIAPS